MLSLLLETTEDFNDPVYIVGNFNNWQANDEHYRMVKEGPGRYRYTFPDNHRLPNVLEYKYTRGDWTKVEVTREGDEIENRKLPKNAAFNTDRVMRWADQGRPYKKEYLPIIQTISEAFERPQLIKTRRIAALLPHNYHQTNRHYPVLYLQDGQNLFDDFAPFGNWGVDKQLAFLMEKGQGDVIVVAIDHAESERIREFTPSGTNTHFGKGDGKAYVRFLKETLKPFVDQHFRTIPDRWHTGIGGSSMGGLISIYAGLMFPEVYSKLMIFSPSLWVAPNIHFHSLKLNETLDTKIYIYAGGSESQNMVPNIRRFKTALQRQNSSANLDFKLNIDPQGRHNEAKWGEEFPRALQWLFYG